MKGDGVIVAPPTPRKRRMIDGRSLSHSFAARRRERKSRNGSPFAGVSLQTRMSAASAPRWSWPIGGKSTT